MKEVGQHLDKRAEPRFVCRLPVNIKSEFGDIAEAIVANISLTGLQLLANGPTISILFPNFKRINHAKPINLAMQFNVPTSKCERTTVKLQANVVYIRRVHHEVFAIGCEFTRLLDEATDDLTDYIYYHGQPL